MDDNDIAQYMSDRVDDQLRYFDSNAQKNQRRYKLLKRIAIACTVLTTVTIALAFIVLDSYRVGMGMVTLVLSSIVLATYQIEEFENYGAKWEKFRLVAEQLKSEEHFFISHSGRYTAQDDSENKRLLVETVESIVKGTDISYFSLIIDPGRRINKRMGAN